MNFTDFMGVVYIMESWFFVKGCLSKESNGKPAKHGWALQFAEQCSTKL